MLLTRRMERMGLGPLGFVATDYVIAIWSVKECRDVDALFDQDMLGDDLEEWMAESSLLKRTFRNVAVIAGLIERKLPGHEKSGRQVTFNADLIYDVLRRHQPDHILLQATRQDAARGLTDISRLAGLLTRVQGRIVHRRLDRVSPLAVPILLEIGREQVAGGAVDILMDELTEELVAEATGGEMQGGLRGKVAARNRSTLRDVPLDLAHPFRQRRRVVHCHGVSGDQADREAGRGVDRGTAGRIPGNRALRHVQQPGDILLFEVAARHPGAEETGAQPRPALLFDQVAKLFGANLEIRIVTPSQAVAVLVDLDIPERLQITQRPEDLVAEDQGSEINLLGPAIRPCDRHDVLGTDILDPSHELETVSLHCPVHRPSPRSVSIPPGAGNCSRAPTSALPQGHVPKRPPP